MTGSEHKEYLTCYTYEPDQERDECCGASGRKLRRVCGFCPNYERFRERIRRQKSEKEGNEHEKSD